jgi:hypothetical protein
MRDLIKILIALAFIAGSFWVGKYMADEKCSKQLKEVNSKTETDTKLIQQLHDSINALKADFENEKAKHKIDTVKIKPVVIKK